MLLKQKALSGVVWSTIESWGNQIMSFLILVTLLRLLDPESFGTAAMAMALIAPLVFLINMGFASTIVQRRDLSEAMLDTVFWTNCVIGSALAVVVWFGAGWMASLYQQSQLEILLQSLTPLLILNALSVVQGALLQRNFAFKPLSIRRLVATLFGGVIGITFAYQGLGVWSLIAQALTGAAVSVAILWRASAWRPQLRYSFNELRSSLRFSRHIMLSSVLGILNLKLAEILIGFFLGPAQVAFFNIAMRIREFVLELITSILNRVTLPVFSNLQNDRAGLSRAYLRTVQASSFLGLPAFAGLGILAPQIVRVVLGPDWTQAIPLVQLLSLAGAIHVLFYLNANVFIACGKPDWQWKLLLAHIFVNTIIIVSTMHFGLTTVAAAYVAGKIILLIPIQFLAIRAIIGVSATSLLSVLYVNGITTLVLCGILLFYSIIKPLKMLETLDLIVGIGLGVIVYGFLSILLNRKFLMEIMQELMVLRKSGTAIK